MVLVYHIGQRISYFVIDAAIYWNRKYFVSVIV